MGGNLLSHWIFYQLHDLSLVVSFQKGFRISSQEAPKLLNFSKCQPFATKSLFNHIFKLKDLINAKVIALLVNFVITIYVLVKYFAILYFD